MSKSKAKNIEKRELKKLSVRSTASLRRKEKKAILQQQIPVKSVRIIERGVSLVPDYCPIDLDKCPAPCGACVVVPDASSRKGIRFREKIVLDTEHFKP